jgi:hypothetical protein
MMEFARPAGAFKTLLGQLILLTQIVLIAQAHPYSNHSLFPVGSENNLHHVVARATDAQFTALPNSGRIRVHTSCLSYWNLGEWDATMEQLKVVVSEFIQVSRAMNTGMSSEGGVTFS